MSTPFPSPPPTPKSPYVPGSLSESSHLTHLLCPFYRRQRRGSEMLSHLATVKSIGSGRETRAVVWDLCSLHQVALLPPPSPHRWEFTGAAS